MFGLLCLLSLSRWQRTRQFCPLLHAAVVTAGCALQLCSRHMAAQRWPRDADVSLLSGMSRYSERCIMPTTMPATCICTSWPGLA
jgi:hypothetical protein